MQCKCLCGCEVSLSLCFYLQMHTFGRIGIILVHQCNWSWNQHGDMSLKSVAHTGIYRSTVHYSYECTLWRPWTYIVFHNSMLFDILTAGSSLNTKDHHCNHIISRYNSAYIFITFSLILHSMASCSQIQPLIIIHIFKNLCSDLLCFPQPVSFLLAFQHLISHAEFNLKYFYCDFLLPLSGPIHFFLCL